MGENGDYSALIDYCSKNNMVSNLKKAYSGEGVPTLNVASKVESLSALRYNPTKSKKQTWLIFGPIHSLLLTENSASSVKTVTNKTTHPEMVARAKPLHRYTLF